MTSISDALLFGDEPLPVPVKPTERVSTAKAATVITALVSSGRRLPYGVDMTAMEQVWAVELDDFDVADLMGAAHEWNKSEGNDFPTVAEVAVCARGVRSDRQRALHGNDKCVRCDDVHFTENPRDELGRTSMSACPTCNSIRYEHVRDNHKAPRNRQPGCSLCEASKKPGRWR